MPRSAHSAARIGPPRASESADRWVTVKETSSRFISDATGMKAFETSTSGYAGLVGDADIACWFDRAAGVSAPS